MHILIFLLLLYQVQAKTCSGHDGCKNLIVADSSLTCSGGERCCKNVRFTCTTPSCTVTVRGGGHDQLQDSEIFGQESDNLIVNCQASGLRECTKTKIFCPANGTCACRNCPSSAIMYCPHQQTCTPGGATLKPMNEYFCKGSGSNVYCEDPTYKIAFCSSVQDHCISVIESYSHYLVTCVKNSVYERPKCPEYYQDKYENVKYNTINITVNEDAALPLEELCKKSIPPANKLIKSSNRAFQIKSWNTGCEKKKPKLNKCKSACNNPQGCCGLTCASNSCSGGGCCVVVR